MSRRILIGLIAAVSVLGGIAGIHTATQGDAAPMVSAASIQCTVTWAIPDPAVAAKDKTKNYLRVSGQQRTSSQEVEPPPLRAQIIVPYAALPAKKSCTGGDPLNLTWETWVGDKHIDDLWFLNSSTDEQPFSSADPWGLRIWKGRTNPADPNITFIGPQPVDARLGTNLDSNVPPIVNGLRTFTVSVLKYVPATDSMGPHKDVGVTLQYRCWPSETWLYYGLARSDPTTGKFTFTVRDDNICPATGWQSQHRGVIKDTPDAWGFSQYIS